MLGSSPGQLDYDCKSVAVTSMSAGSHIERWSARGDGQRRAGPQINTKTRARTKWWRRALTRQELGCDAACWDRPWTTASFMGPSGHCPTTQLLLACLVAR